MARAGRRGGGRRLRGLPLALGAALGGGALALGFAAWPPARARRCSRAASATQTLAEGELTAAVDEQPTADHQVVRGFGLASVLEQQLYDQKVIEETRFVREQAKLPWWRRSFARLAGDLGGLLTSPVRTLRLVKITKDVVTERLEYYKTIKDRRSQPEDGDGQARQGMRGDIRAFAKGSKTFFATYLKSHVIARTPYAEYREMLHVTLTRFLESVAQKDPYSFEPFHKAVRGPHFDYYSWGNRFIRPMIKQRSSQVDGQENVRKIQDYLANGDNVVMICNHQTEVDPQVLSVLLESEGYAGVAEKTIFVAGHKVTTDPLAIPFSIGRNLLTIFSKKYLESFEDEGEKESAAARNRQTVAEMQRLLTEGGNIFWVAPSGGRDRRDPETGEFTPAKFDASSVGLFNLLAKRAEKAGTHRTRFFPLAMWTHRLMPPPEGAVSAVGEERSAQMAAVALAFGEEVDPEDVGGRKAFPEAIERRVSEAYWSIHEVMRWRK